MNDWVLCSERWCSCCALWSAFKLSPQSQMQVSPFLGRFAQWLSFRQSCSITQFGFRPFLTQLDYLFYSSQAYSAPLCRLDWCSLSLSWEFLFWKWCCWLLWRLCDCVGKVRSGSGFPWFRKLHFLQSSAFPRVTSWSSAGHNFSSHSWFSEKLPREVRTQWLKILSFWTVTIQNHESLTVGCIDWWRKAFWKEVTDNFSKISWIGKMLIWCVS